MTEISLVEDEISPGKNTVSDTTGKSSRVHYDLLLKNKNLPEASTLSLIWLHLEADGLGPNAFLVQEVRVAACGKRLPPATQHPCMQSETIHVLTLGSRCPE